MCVFSFCLCTYHTGLSSGVLPSFLILLRECFSLGWICALSNKWWPDILHLTWTDCRKNHSISRTLKNQIFGFQVLHIINELMVEAITRNSCTFIFYLAFCSYANALFWNESTTVLQPLHGQIALLVVHSCYSTLRMLFWCLIYINLFSCPCSRYFFFIM